MKSLRLLLILFCVVPPLVAQTAPPSASTTETPATAAELAYWKKLQTDIAEFRSANASYQAKNFMELSVVQMNEIMARLETFLDVRDADQVDALGADLQAYRTQFLAMLDSALTPLRLAAKGKSTAAGTANYNPQETMMNLMRANTQFKTVDGYKSELHRLHLAIDRRIGAAGGPRILFFDSLNLGDNADFDFAASTPAQRDEKFVAASRAIDPALGVLAEKQFLKFRADGRLDEEIEAKRDDILQHIDSFGRQKEVAQMNEAQLDAQVKGIPADFTDEQRALFEVGVNFVKRKRVSGINASIALQDWQAVFAQWLGKADGLTPANGCSDLAVSAKEGWFAFTPDGREVIARSVATGDVVFTVTSEHTIRGLVFGADSALYAFTTGGLYRLPPPAGSATPKFTAVNTVTSQTVLGVIAAASQRDRFAYAWGAAGAIAAGGRESLFQATSTSLTTAAAINADGRKVAFGHSGRNDTGPGRKNWGLDVLQLPESDDALAALDIQSKRYTTTYAAPITAVAFSPDSNFLAATTSQSSFGTVDIFDLTKGENNRTQLALDNQPYDFVHFIGSGDSLAVLAGASNGMVRVWSVKTGELTARFQVPTGPQGVAMNVAGDTLISTSLGSPGLHRWSTTDGTLLATWTGDAPKIDTATLAADLKAEQARRPLIAKFYQSMILAKPHERAAEKLLQSDGTALDAAGLRSFVDRAVLSSRESELIELDKAGNYAEVVRQGRASINQGLVSKSIYFSMINAARESAPQTVTALIDEALRVYPQSPDVRYQYHWQRQTDFSTAGRVDEAMKEVDQMDSIRPNSRPHHDSRFYVLLRGAAHASNTGNKQLAITYYTRSLDHAETKAKQLDALRAIFPLAYGIGNWNLAVRAISGALELDPNLKNDQQLMDAARYAYQMNQKQSGK